MFKDIETKKKFPSLRVHILRARSLFQGRISGAEEFISTIGQFRRGLLSLRWTSSGEACSLCHNFQFVLNK